MDDLRRVRRAGRRVPRRPRDPRRRARRRGRDHRQQPRRVGRRVLRLLRPRRRLRADVRGAARQGVGVHPPRLRGQGRHRRHRRHDRRRCAGCGRSCPALKHVDRARAARDRRPLLRGAPRRPDGSDPAPAGVARRPTTSPASSTPPARPATRRASSSRTATSPRTSTRCTRSSRSTADDRSLSFLPWAHSFGQTCELHCLLCMGARWRSATTSRSSCRTSPR